MLCEQFFTFPVTFSLAPFAPLPPKQNDAGANTAFYYTKCNYESKIVCTQYNRGLSCDVISSQFCKSSYLHPPCWFPLSMAQYGKIQQTVLLLFI